MSWRCLKRERGGVRILVPVFWLRGRGYRIESDEFSFGGWVYLVGLGVKKEWGRLSLSVSWGRVPQGHHIGSQHG